MGDCPCEADCAIFGMLAQIYWHMPDSQHHSLIKGEQHQAVFIYRCIYVCIYVCMHFLFKWHFISQKKNDPQA